MTSLSTSASVGIIPIIRPMPPFIMISSRAGQRQVGHFIFSCKVAAPVCKIQWINKKFLPSKACMFFPMPVNISRMSASSTFFAFTANFALWQQVKCERMLKNITNRLPVVDKDLAAIGPFKAETRKNGATVKALSIASGLFRDFPARVKLARTGNDD